MIKNVWEKDRLVEKTMGTHDIIMDLREAIYVHEDDLKKIPSLDYDVDSQTELMISVFTFREDDIENLPHLKGIKGGCGIEIALCQAPYEDAPDEDWVVKKDRYLNIDVSDEKLEAAIKDVLPEGALEEKQEEEEKEV